MERGSLRKKGFSCETLNRGKNMPAAVISAFLAFTFITAFTPGPNNILALSSGSRYGFRGSAVIVAGICTGFFCVMILCGVTAFSLSALSDGLITIMKYIGCAYIIWLAWKIATASTTDTDSGQAKTGFLSAFILQFVNIKIIIYGLAAFSGFVLPYYDSYMAIIWFILLLTLIGSAGVLTWALVGSALQRFFAQHARKANVAMGGMLLGCAVSLLL